MDSPCANALERAKYGMALNAQLQDLGQGLRSQREEIMKEWLAELEAEPLMVASRSLNVVDLRNHISQLLESLSGQLQVAVNHRSVAAALKDAETHGDARWTQKFQLPELFREIAILRTIVIERVECYASSHPEFDDEARCNGHKIIHRFFDALIAGSAQQFSKLKEDAATKAQQELQALNDALEQRNREYAAVDAARARMVRILAHELRNPLNVLSLAARVINSRDEQIRVEATETIQRAVAAYRSLLDQILEFSRTEEAQTVHTTSFELKPVFEELVLFTEAEAKSKGLEFHVCLAPTLPAVVSDKTRVLLIAKNLLSNAVKYTNSGSVDFSVRAVSEDSWEIEVRDTGHGIPESEREAIFAEFHRMAQHSGTHGTGLGLSIVQRAVDTLGGSINVQSELGKGSRFVVRLPRVTSIKGD